MRIGIDASLISTNLASSHARVTRLVMAALERSAGDGLVALHPTGAVFDEDLRGMPFVAFGYPVPHSGANLLATVVAMR